MECFSLVAVMNSTLDIWLATFLSCYLSMCQWEHIVIKEGGIFFFHSFLRRSSTDMEYFIFFFLLLRLWRLKSPRFNPKDTVKCQNTHTGNSQTAELLHFVTKSMRLLNLSCCLFSFLSFYFSVAPIWL